MGFSDYDVLPYHIIDLFTPQRKHQGNDQELSPFCHHHHHPVQADLAMLDHNSWGRLPNLVGTEMPFFCCSSWSWNWSAGQVWGPVVWRVVDLQPSSCQDGRRWGALAPQLGRLDSETQVCSVQRGSLERARVVYVAALKAGLVFGGRGDRIGGRGEPCSTRGHCDLAAQPRNMESAQRKQEAFSKGFFQAESSPRSGYVSHPPAPGHAALHPAVPTSGSGCTSSMGDPRACGGGRCFSAPGTEFG